MAEAVGIASAAITFLDFVLKVYSNARKIYDSADGQTEADTSRESLITTIDELANLLQSTDTTGDQSVEERQIGKLARQCQEMAQELRSQIESRKRKAKSRSRSKPTILHAIRAAHLIVWSESKEKDALRDLRDHHNMLFML